MTHFFLSVLFVISSNLGYGNFYPGVTVGVENDYLRLSATGAWSRKEMKPNQYSGWGYNVRGSVNYKHLLVGGEVNSEMTSNYTKTAYYPKAGLRYKYFTVEGLFPDNTQNKAAGVRFTHVFPDSYLYKWLSLEWELDRYYQDNKPLYGGKITFIYTF